MEACQVLTLKREVYCGALRLLQREESSIRGRGERGVSHSSDGEEDRKRGRGGRRIEGREGREG